MSDLSQRDAKLVQYLNEAYSKEKQLETSLQAHIAMTTRQPYRKRLNQHFSETKRHARELERRIRQLGGTAEAGPIEGPDAVAKGASAAVALTSRAVAAAKGPLHAIRGTGEQEKMLKNAKTQYADEHEEIATYTAIETLAKTVGDGATAKLARAIRREEERMAGFLERLIPSLTRAVTQEEIPAAQRNGSSRAAGTKRRASSAKRASTTKAASKAKRSATAKRSASAKRTTRSASATTTKRGGSAKETSAKRATAKRTTAKRTTAKRATTKRATAKRSTATKPAGAKRAASSRRRTAAGARA